MIRKISLIAFIFCLGKLSGQDNLQFSASIGFKKFNTPNSSYSDFSLRSHSSPYLALGLDMKFHRTLLGVQTSVMHFANQIHLKKKGLPPIDIVSPSYPVATVSLLISHMVGLNDKFLLCPSFKLGLVKNVLAGERFYGGERYLDTNTVLRSSLNIKFERSFGAYLGCALGLHFVASKRLTLISKVERTFGFSDLITTDFRFEVSTGEEGGIVVPGKFGGWTMNFGIAYVLRFY